MATNKYFSLNLIASYSSCQPSGEGKKYGGGADMKWHFTILIEGSFAEKIFKLLFHLCNVLY
jgi:hypothetical protein